MVDIVEKAHEDIRSMKVRGALDIAICAAETLKDVTESGPEETSELLDVLRSSGDRLKQARPTAVSLPNAVDFILNLAEKNKGLKAQEFKSDLAGRIESFIQEQENALERIADIGANIIEDGDVILTHCNSDTVVLILKRAWNQGKKIEVICDETRPRHQGYLTAKALAEHGIPTTLVVDSAAHLMMKELKVDRIFVGSDTVYSNGDMINKIGTSQVALSAKTLGIDFIVATESIKLCPQSLLGSKVAIEYRDPEEIVDKDSLPGVRVLNPAFDITAADDISFFVTEYGVIPPEAIYQLLREKFGWELDF